MQTKPSVQPVSSSRMEFKHTVLTLLMGSLLLGCQPRNVTEVVPPSTSTPDSSNPDSSKPEPKKPPKTDFSINKEVFAIATPKSAGWKEANTKLVEIGSKMDAAVADLKMALGHADTVYEVGGAKLMGRGDIKIQDSKVFAIDFYTSKTEAGRNRIVSDGKKRRVFYAEQWFDKPTPGAPTERPYSDDELSDWPAMYTKFIFLRFSDDRTVWRPLFGAWSSGRGGFTARVESKSMKVNEVEKPFFRIVADRKSDNAQIEIVVDGTRYVPLTIRTVVKNSKGTEDKRFWTCQWAFSGGTFDPKDFIVPTRS